MTLSFLETGGTLIYETLHTENMPFEHLHITALMGGPPEWLLPTIPVHHLFEVAPVWSVDRC